MSLEFGSSFVESTSKAFEGIKPVLSELDEYQRRLLESNAKNLEFASQFNSLCNDIELFSMRELSSAGFQKTKTYTALEQLSKKCQAAKSLDEIKALRAQFETLVKPLRSKQYDAALLQTGINASAGVVKQSSGQTGAEILSTPKSAVEGVKNGAEIIKEKAAGVQQAVSSGAASVPLKPAVIDSAEHQKLISQEALRRTKAEKAAPEIAAKAQRFYTSLSDSSTGKSAQESAKVIEAALQAAEEQQKQAAASVVSQSSETVKTAADKIAETVVNQSDDTAAKLKGGKFKEGLSKLGKLVKEKVVPFTKTKQFKYLAALGAVIVSIAVGAGIVKHNKTKESTSDNLNIVR